MHKPKPIHLVSYATLAIAFVLMVYFAWLAFWPFKGIDIYVQPYPVVTPTVVAGEQVKYEIDYCRYTDVDSHVVHQLVHGVEIIRIPATDTRLTSTSDGLRLREGCDTATKAVHIPPYIEPGEYKLVEIVSYGVNFLQTITYTFETEPFTVVE